MADELGPALEFNSIRVLCVTCHWPKFSFEYYENNGNMTTDQFWLRWEQHRRRYFWKHQRAMMIGIAWGCCQWLQQRPNAIETKTTTIRYIERSGNCPRGYSGKHSRSDEDGAGWVIFKRMWVAVMGKRVEKLRKRRVGVERGKEKKLEAPNLYTLQWD